MTMPKKGQYTAEFDSCVKKAKSGGAKNPYAVCIASFRKAGKKIWIGEDKMNKYQLSVLHQMEQDYDMGILLFAFESGSYPFSEVD
jgi:hypothetical protein